MSERRIMPATMAEMEQLVGHQNEPSKTSQLSQAGQNPTLIEASQALGVGKIASAEGGIINLSPDQEKEQEAIIDQGAEEFADEAELHPERYYRMAEWIKQWLDHFEIKKPKIIDAGCGPGQLLMAMADLMPDGEFVGLDLSPTMLARAEKSISRKGLALGKQVHLVRNNYAQAPILRGFADAVVGRNALHRADSLGLNLSQMASMTNQGGTLLNSSFMSIRDMDQTRQARLVQDIVARNEYPELQRLLLEAYVNAPRFAEYDQAARTVADEHDMRYLSVKPVADLNSVNIVMSKREVN